MADDAKSTATPRLRFPEFRDDWNAVAVGDFFDLTDKAEKATTFAKDRVLTVRLYANGVVKNDKTTLTGGANYFKRRAGQFIFSKIDLLNGAFGIVPDQLDGFSSSSDVPAYSFNTAHSKPFFLSWLKANYRRLEIERTGTSSTLKRVSPEKFLALALLAPTPTEQQKIADCLTSLDEVIAAQGRKVEALKVHKRGLMQQLFPREGETLPRLRFPEFRDSPEWETKLLRQIARYENGKAYEQDIVEDGKYIVVNSRFISTDGAVRKYSDSEYCIATAGDVLMVLSDLPNGRALAKCLFVEVDDRYAVNQRVCRLTDLKSTGRFLYYCLNRHPYLLAFDDGLGQTHLRKEAVLDCPLSMPPQGEEQQRIADCLSSLDAQIAAEAEKLDALKTHKKGLMQQLFPSPEGN